MVNLKDINKENFWEVIELKVNDEQKKYVLENSISIAQAKVQPECIPMAIYNDKTLVGFLMYCIDTDDGNYWIYRFMIDKNFQRNGYGKKAMELLLTEIKKDKHLKTQAKKLHTFANMQHCWQHYIPHPHCNLVFFQFQVFHLKLEIQFLHIHYRHARTQHAPRKPSQTHSCLGCLQHRNRYRRGRGPFL